MKSWLLDNVIEMYSTQNVYTDKLNEIAGNYNNTYQETIKIKPADVPPSFYIEYCVEHNDKDPTFKVSGQFRIGKDKNIFAIDYTPYFSEEVFVIKKVKSTVP